jgi:hypothetical protein
MNNSFERSAARVAHDLVADLWEELPGDDKDKDGWKSEFKTLLIRFDLAHQQSKVSGFQLVRKAWDTAYQFHAEYVCSEWEDYHTKAIFCGKIARRILQYVGTSPQVFWANMAWNTALINGTYEVVNHQN